MCEIRDEVCADVGGCDLREPDCEVRAWVCWDVFEEGEDAGEVCGGKVGECRLAQGIEKLSEGFGLWVFGMFRHFCGGC